uniref:atrophin-1-like n=1 Tax=Halichoerus grypus TaxID=9711 RepID=UPI0016593F93|nr:atrophin-1-like [Halichoerus grypus]
MKFGAPRAATSRPPALRAGSVVVFLGLLLPAPRLPLPLSGGAACVPRARPPASRPQGTASAPPAPRRRGRRDPRPRPLATQSFGGGGKCPGSGAASGGSGRAGFPPSSSSPPYRLPPPPLLLPRSPWGCSPAARNNLLKPAEEKEDLLESLHSYPWSAVVQMFHQKVSSRLTLCHDACVSRLTSSHHVGISSSRVIKRKSRTPQIKRYGLSSDHKGNEDLECKQSRKS